MIFSECCCEDGSNFGTMQILILPWLLFSHLEAEGCTSVTSLVQPRGRHHSMLRCVCHAELAPACHLGRSCTDCLWMRCRKRQGRGGSSTGPLHASSSGGLTAIGIVTGAAGPGAQPSAVAGPAAAVGQPASRVQHPAAATAVGHELWRHLKSLDRCHAIRVFGFKSLSALTKILMIDCSGGTAVSLPAARQITALRLTCNVCTCKGCCGRASQGRPNANAHIRHIMLKMPVMAPAAAVPSANQVCAMQWKRISVFISCCMTFDIEHSLAVQAQLGDDTQSRAGAVFHLGSFTFRLETVQHAAPRQPADRTKGSIQRQCLAFEPQLVNSTLPTLHTAAPLRCTMHMCISERRDASHSVRHPVTYNSDDTGCQHTWEEQCALAHPA